MKRARLIDKKTGELKSCMLSEIYRYCLNFDKGNTGYKCLPYGGLAHAVGLPWLFAYSDNAETIVILRAALARLASRGLIRVKPAAHTTIYVQVTTAKQR